MKKAELALDTRVLLLILFISEKVNVSLTVDDAINSCNTSKIQFLKRKLKMISQFICCLLN